MGLSIRSLAALAACALSLVALAPEAKALVSIAYVTPTGSPTANCQSRSTPCNSLMQAETQIVEGGTIVVYGAGVVTGTRLAKPMTIVGDGQTLISSFGFALSAGQKATVSDVRISNGLFYIIGSGKIILRNVTIDNNQSFTNAINFQGGPGARLSLERVSITNGSVGVFVKGVGGAATTVFLDGCKINQAETSGVYVEGPSTAVLIGTTISGSGQIDLQLVDGAKAISYGNNVIRTGAPTQTLPEN